MPLLQALFQNADALRFWDDKKTAGMRRVQSPGSQDSLTTQQPRDLHIYGLLKEASLHSPAARESDGDARYIAGFL